MSIGVVGNRGLRAGMYDRLSELYVNFRGRQSHRKSSQIFLIISLSISR